jgi:hypothetical protein
MMQDEWIRMGLLVGVAVVMFVILKTPKKGKSKHRDAQRRQEKEK